MRIIGLLIVMCATLMLVYYLAGDTLGIKKGDNAERKIAPMAATQEAVKKMVNYNEAMKETVEKQEK